MAGLTRPNLSQLRTTANVSIVDPLTVLHAGSTGPNQDVGFIISRGPEDANVALFWNETTDAFTVAYTGNSGIFDSNVIVGGLANVSANYIGGTLLTSSQPNISTIGTLSSLNVNGDAVINGSLVVNGDHTIINTVSLTTSDKAIVVANSAANSAAAIGSGFQIGDSAIASFLFDGANAFITTENIYPAGNVTQDLGSPTKVWRDVYATRFVGDGSSISGISSYGNSNVATYLPTYTGLFGGTITSSSQPYITSLGNLTSLSASGAITTSGVFVGNGSGLYAVPGATDYTNSNVALYIPTYQGNIGTVNTGNLNLTGNINFTSAQGSGILVNSNYGWNSIKGDITPYPSGSSAPSMKTYMGSFQWWSYVAHDGGNMIFTIPYDYAPGTDLYMELHWGHNGTGISGSLIVDSTMTSSKGFGQSAFTPMATSQLAITSINIANTPQYQHRTESIQLSVHGGSSAMINSDSLEPGSIVMVNYILSQVPSVQSGSTFVFSAELIYKSTVLPTKNRTPNFYS